MSDFQLKNHTPTWMKILWIAIISFSIIVVFVAHINFNEPLLGRSTFVVIFGCIHVVSSYIFELKPSKKKYRLAYIVYLGLLSAIFIWFFMLPLGVLDWMTYEVGLSDGATLVASFLISWGIGAVVVEIIGRIRKYKGPAYNPFLSD